MTVFAFVGSVVVTGAVMTLIQVGTGTSQASQPDYHLVPYAGDAFGA